MSLLLDALNRASKDKAALSAATVSRAVEPTLESPDPKPDRVGNAAPTVATPVADFSTLGLSLTAPDSAPTVTSANQAGATSTKDTVDTDLQLVTEPEPMALPVTHKFKAEPMVEPAPAVAPKPPAAINPSLASTSPEKLLQTTRLVSPSGNGPRVAQTILRAQAPNTKDNVPKRLIALGTVAVLLAAGLGSVLMGLWGDPLSWFQTSALQQPAGQATVMAKAIEPAAMPTAASVVPQPPPSAPSQLAIQTPASTAAIVKPQTKPRTRAGTARTDLAPHPPTQLPSDNKVASRPKPRAIPSNGTQALLQASAGPSALEAGYAALTQGRLQEAQRAYTRALLVNSEERDALLGLAYIAQREGRAQEAKAYYMRVLRQEPGNPIAKSGLLTLSPADDVQALGSRAREVAEQNPDSAAAQSALGQSLVRQRRLADARLAFSRAQQLEPSVALHAFNLAVALDRLHDYAQAQMYYQRALTLSAQTGGEHASGVPHAVVQARLEQLQAAAVATPAGSR